jgi:siroheme synthase
MDISHLNTGILTHTAIAALKNAYEQCSDRAAKESIIAAFKAIIQLHYDLGKHNSQDKTDEFVSDYDPSEYCAAV